MIDSRRRTDIEQRIGLFALDVDYVDCLAHEIHQTLRYPRNILSFSLECGEGDSYGDAERGLTLPFQPGFFYFLPKGNLIRFERSMKTRTLTCHFELTYRPGCDVFTKEIPCMMKYDPAGIRRIRRLLADRDSAAAAFCLKTEIMQICSEFLPDLSAEQMRGQEKFTGVLEYLRKNVSAGIGVAELAEFCNMRQDVFSRSFKKNFGVPPHQVICQELGRRVVEYLSLDFSLKEIADALHFSSEFYLSRFFRKQYGIPPSVWRENLIR